MEKARSYIYYFCTYVVPFGLIYYITGPDTYLSTSVTLAFACALLIMLMSKKLSIAREISFIIISIFAVGFAVGKLTNPYMCGGVSGLFAALLYTYLMNKFIWTSVTESKEDNQ